MVIAAHEFNASRLEAKVREKFAPKEDAAEQPAEDK